MRREGIIVFWLADLEDGGLKRVEGESMRGFQGAVLLVWKAVKSAGVS